MLNKNENYLIVGLGLLGGKYALELSRAGYHVAAINRSKENLQWALENGYAAEGKTEHFEDLIEKADHIIFGLYPTALIQWVETYGKYIRPGCIATDVSGVKTGLVEKIQELMPQGAEFIASHPMAGKEVSGVRNAVLVDFTSANFIITPTPRNTPAAIVWATELAYELKFARITVLTPQQHDEMIGYVSQLCHAIAVSLMCASDNTDLARYTGDSFRDLTRIAKINAEMWAELFLWNRENLAAQIDQFTATLQQMKGCLEREDRQGLEEMFRLSTARRTAFDQK
ncbi:MAG: prephenate dehydrogenase [Oscillospiraceae bacterium]|nr:prephenate dehydrogenase [Oscillospiraceae bacterium]